MLTTINIFLRLCMFETFTIEFLIRVHFHFLQYFYRRSCVGLCRQEAKYELFYFAHVVVQPGPAMHGLRPLDKDRRCKVKTRHASITLH